MVDQIHAYFQTLQSGYQSDRYALLNAFRDWINQNLLNYEMFLEDNWFDDHTTIEYTLRSLDTFNIQVIAEDTYHNHRDDKGVWHLGHYIETHWTVPDPEQTLSEFLESNSPPRFRDFPTPTETSA
jgi:hypothetical protein